MRLTDYLAIYAAGLSTLVFLWNTSTARSRVRLQIVPGASSQNDEVQIGLHISVQNVSAHTVHISSLSILYPYRQVGVIDYLSHLVKYRRIASNIGWVHTRPDYYDVEDGFPVSIEARKSHDIFIPEGALEKLLDDAIRREIRAGIQDALWRNKYSKTFKVDWRGEY